MRMNKSWFCRLPAAIIVIACSLVLTSCEGTWDVPITEKPTQKIEAKLLGDWKEKGGNDVMKVRKYDEETYIISFDGDLYRAFHSQTDDLALITVQDIDSASRKYVYFVYRLSSDGSALALRPINEKVVLKTAKTPADIRTLLRQHAKDADLFEETGEFVHQ